MNQIAQTIYQQLGGNRFAVMTGMNSLSQGPNTLQFRFGRGAVNKANTIIIKLNPSDTYTMDFFSIRGLNIRKISSHSMVEASELQRLFTRETGMDTHL